MISSRFLVVLFSLATRIGAQDTYTYGSLAYEANQYETNEPEQSGSSSAVVDQEETKPVVHTATTGTYGRLADAPARNSVPSRTKASSGVIYHQQSKEDHNTDGGLSLETGQYESGRISSDSATERESRSSVRSSEEENPTEKDASPYMTQHADTSTTATTTTTASNVSVSSFNATALSFSACEKLDLALKFMTSFDFQQHFRRTFPFSHDDDISEETRLEHLKGAESSFYATVYMLQMIVTPLSIGLLLFGASLFLQVCVVSSASVGLFVVFGLIDVILPFTLECPMKLALAVAAAVICAFVATACFQFALFSFGAFAVGGASYVAFDTFPQLDPGVIVFSAVFDDATTASSSGMPTTDLSNVAWFIVVGCAIGGGAVLRYYERATLELMTAMMGGVGCAYSVHTFALVNQVKLDISVIFLIAFFLSMTGWIFQRRRRFASRHLRRKSSSYEQLPTTHHEAYPVGTNLTPIELQMQINSMRDGLAAAHNNRNSGSADSSTSPTSDQISELTQSINRFLAVVEQQATAATTTGSEKSDKES